MKISIALVGAAAAIGSVAMSLPTRAQTFTGDTTGKPTYERVDEFSEGTQTSINGYSTHYQAVSFSVDTRGLYSFSNASAFDNFLSLYSGAFDPQNPLENVVVANDDFDGMNAGFSSSLTAGGNYVLVATGFDPSQFGAFTLTADGPAPVDFSVGAAPEPGSWALMIIGFGIVGHALRRRRVSFPSNRALAA